MSDPHRIEPGHLTASRVYRTRIDNPLRLVAAFHSEPWPHVRRSSVANKDGAQVGSIDHHKKGSPDRFEPHWTWSCAAHPNDVHQTRTSAIRALTALAEHLLTHEPTGRRRRSPRTAHVERSFRAVAAAAADPRPRPPTRLEASGVDGWVRITSDPPMFEGWIRLVTQSDPDDA